MADEEWVDIDEAYAAALEEFGDLEAQIEELSVDSSTLPVVAIIGRPNVGKSTLVNRIIGRREVAKVSAPSSSRSICLRLSPPEGLRR